MPTSSSGDLDFAFGLPMGTYWFAEVQFNSWDLAGYNGETERYGCEILMQVILTPGPDAYPGSGPDAGWYIYPDSPVLIRG